jgi:hypothetical protein
MEANRKYDWDYLGWKSYSLSSDGLTQNEWNQTLITRINQASAWIGKDTYRGTANVLYMHPKTFTIFKSLEYYDQQSNTLSGRYAIVVDDKLPKDKIFVKFENNRSSSALKLGEGQVFAVKKPQNLNELSLMILNIYSHSFDEIKNDPEYTVITDKLCTGEITINNHRTIDPVTGEILIDYHNEISQDIWLGTYPDEPELSDLVMVDEKAIPEIIKHIESKNLVNTPKSSVVVNIQKPWYKRIFDFFMPTEQVKIKNVTNSKININIK